MSGAGQARIQVLFFTWKPSGTARGPHKFRGNRLMDCLLKLGPLPTEGRPSPAGPRCALPNAHPGLARAPTHRLGADDRHCCRRAGCAGRAGKSARHRQCRPGIAPAIVSARLRHSPVAVHARQ
ncbi:hypothetical protein WR25_18640 [Diploscapter pachys]|uniref:Uncharacterized protein n=1 Tax=Diploscapter pachys TaxID=2018661 RepID=A0A2A2M4Z7_9BILA|nr:hypothetical protein WR25_18640 [Diploscapter pachys]